MTPPLRLPLVPHELKESGVVVRSLREALADEPAKVGGLLGRLSGKRVDAAAAENEENWRDGIFVRVPKGRRCAAALQLGSDLARPAHERTLVVIEEGASLRLIEGCGAGGPGEGRRTSVLEAFVGAGGELRGASVQALPSGVDYGASKLIRAEAGATVEWLDANLGARKAVKRLRLELAGEGARGELLLAGFAGPGQEMVLEGWALCAAGTSLALSSAAARRGGKISARFSAVLDDPAMEVVPRQEELDLDALPEDRRFYMASRGLSPEQIRAFCLHGFFEPFARRLPLEFAVEFSRLLDAETANS